MGKDTTKRDLLNFLSNWLMKKKNSQLVEIYTEYFNNCFVLSKKRKSYCLDILRDQVPVFNV